MSNEITKIIQYNIRSLRTRVGLTQEETAKKLDISRQNYCSYENDIGNIKIEMLIKMAVIFHCTLKDFFYTKESDF